MVLILVVYRKEQRVIFNKSSRAHVFPSFAFSLYFAVFISDLFLLVMVDIFLDLIIEMKNKELFCLSFYPLSA